MASITERPTAGTAAIFVNYRREDSSGYAGRLFDRLRTHYGADSVFWDISGSIEPGIPFPDAIDRAIASCDAILAIIGPQWLTCVDSGGQRRLDDGADFVRLELAKAMGRGIRVIPILVQRTTMPGAEELPEDLKPLARYQAVELSDSRWDYDVSQLLLTLDKVLNRAPKRSQSVVPMAIAAVAVIALVVAGTFWMLRRQPDTPVRATEAVQNPGAAASVVPPPKTTDVVPSNRPAAPPGEAKPPADKPAETTPANSATRAPATAGKMPNVRGRPLAEARALITQAGFRVGRISYVGVSDIPAGSVAGSSAPAGVNVRLDASVAIYVSEQAPSGLHAWGMLPLEGSGFTADLDASGGREAPDIRVMNEQVYVLNGASLVSVGPSAPNVARCTRASAKMTTNPVTLRDGLFACVLTNERRLAAVGIQGQNLRFETFASSSSPRSR
jgi:hypothetical protein